MNLYRDATGLLNEQDFRFGLQLITEFYAYFGGANTLNVVLQCHQDKATRTHYLPQILSLGLQLRKAPPEIFQRFLEIVSDANQRKATWPIIKSALDHLFNELHQSNFSARDLEDVIRDFSQNVDVLEQLDPAELTECVRIFKEIDVFTPQFLTASNKELKDITKEFRQRQNKSTRDPRILAALRELIKRFYGIFPYNLQMINVLALLNKNKRFAQIKSGEGKSPIIALTAAMLALHERFVDIITTHHDLAIRDAEKYKPFFQCIGSDANCIPDFCDPEAFNAPIIYASIHQLRAAFLWRQTGALQIDRPFDIAFIDEADSLCIDNNDEPTILTENEARFLEPLLRMVWSFVRGLNGNAIDPQELKNFLAANHVSHISDTDINTLIDGANQALEKREGVDYIVEKNKIVIVNHAHTGELKARCRWTNGCHSFLEIEHGLKVKSDFYISASINNCSYFNFYRHILGVTGTLGGPQSRQNLRELYGLSFYDSPRYLPSRKVVERPIITANSKMHFAEIIRETLEKAQAGRPVLIIVPTIKMSLQLSEAFPTKEQDLTLQVYNGIQLAKPDHIIALAGNPGMITVATNTAARGADIIPTPKADDNGGLYEITTFPTINLRVEEQAFCRTARQGKKGECRYIFNLQDLETFFPNGFPEKEEDILSQWQQERNKLEEKVFQQQMGAKNYRKILMMAQSVAWLFLKNTPENPKAHNLLTPLWSKCFDNIFHAVEKAVHDNLFNQKDFDRIVHGVAEQVLQFCELPTVTKIIQERSGGNILHFLARRNMSKPIRLFAFHQPALLLFQDSYDKLPWQMAKGRKLKTKMEAITKDVEKGLRC